ncbi:MAG TPA: zinc ribbon domain-containing protein [Gemmatimonadales bacterium]|nr:zinc ribbon domain-containing protein [Gemmatimonadales bacterium]
MTQPLPTSTCPACGALGSPGAAFCHQCGTAMGRSPVRAGERLRWMAVGGTIVGGIAVVLGLLLRGSSARPPAADTTPPAAPFAGGGSPGGAPPDISQMTPRERFDRLYNRIMRSAESGDDAGVAQFTPMALQAYGMLDSIDADARYHAAMLRMHTGDVSGAEALADTILLKQPGHLLGYVLLGTAARFQKDSKALARNYTAFLSHYDAEIKAKRPEYTEHARSIEDFKKAAEQAPKS